MPRKHVFGKSHFGGRTPIFGLSSSGLLATEKSVVTRLIRKIRRRLLHRSGGFRGRPIQRSHQNLRYTNPCCHGDENLEILTQHWLYLGLYGRYVQDSCGKQGVFGDCHCNRVNEIFLRPSLVAMATKTG